MLLERKGVEETGGGRRKEQEKNQERMEEERNISKKALIPAGSARTESCLHTVGWRLAWTT